MTRAHFHAISLFAFLLVTACTQDAGPPAAAADPEVARLGERASRVEIIRDDFGVPHIYGKSDADAVFGMLYAQAEDDFPRIERAGWPRSRARTRSSATFARAST
jgi:acyl-homoserine lactone acylase PvdQ